MEFIRITLAGIMALLLCISFSVCGETCQTQGCPPADTRLEVESCESSCCPSQEHQKLSLCGCDCGHGEHLGHFEPEEFLTTHSETSAPEAPEPTDVGSDSIEEGSMARLMSIGGDRLRGPPDSFSSTPRRIAYCVFRL